MAVDVVTAYDQVRNYKNASAFFWAVHHAVSALKRIDREIELGADAVPRRSASGRTSGISKPTEAQAMFELVNVERWLEAKRNERDVLVFVIGCGLEMCELVRHVLSDVHGDALEMHYVDQKTWREVSESLGCSQAHVYELQHQALQWIDEKGWQQRQ